MDTPVTKSIYLHLLCINMIIIPQLKSHLYSNVTVRNVALYENGNISDKPKKQMIKKKGYFLKS